MTVPEAPAPIPIVVVAPDAAMNVKLELLPELIFAPMVNKSASREMSPLFEIAALVEIVPSPLFWLSAFSVIVPDEVLLKPDVLTVMVPSADISIVPVPDADKLVMVKLSSSAISIAPVDDRSALVTSVSIETAPSASITKSTAVILLVPPEIVPSAINQTSPPDFTVIGVDIVKLLPPVSDSSVIVEKLTRLPMLLTPVALVERSRSVTPPKLAPVPTVMPLLLTNIKSTLSLAVIEPANVVAVDPVTLFNTTEAVAWESENVKVWSLATPRFSHFNIAFALAFKLITPTLLPTFV